MIAATSAPCARWAFFLGCFGCDVAHAAGFGSLGLDLLHLGLFLGHALHPGFFAAILSNDEFGLGDFVHQVSLTDGENVLDGPVKRKGGGVVVAEEEEHQRHEHHDALLHFISGFWHHRHLNHAGRGHDDGENVDRDDIAKQRQAKRKVNCVENIWLRKIVNPEERLATEFDSVVEHAEESEEDRDLNEHWQTTAERVDSVFAVKAHRLGVELGGIVFVFFLQLGHFWLELGHAFHRASRFCMKRPDAETDDDGEADDC